MAGTKIGLDDYIMHRRSVDGGEPRADVTSLINRTLPYIPLGDGVDRFADERLQQDAAPESLIEGTAALMARSETQAAIKLKKVVSNAKMRQNIERDARRLLNQVRERQAPMTEQRLRSPKDEVYKEVLTKMKDTPYILDESGNLYYKQHHNHGIATQKLANFIVFPKRNIKIDNGVEEKNYVEIGAILHGGRLFPTQKIPADKLTSLNFVMDVYGAEFNFEPGPAIKDRVRHAFQSMADGIERTTVIGHTGWRKNGEGWIYIHAGGAIGGTD